MKSCRKITISDQDGNRLEVSLEILEDREAAVIFIDGVPYHLERISEQLLSDKYVIDTDPDYTPKTDRSGACVVLAPFCR